jgi:hypothetical protein
MVIGENTDFAVQYNLPEQLQGVPLEVIVLPLGDSVNATKNKVAELEDLIRFNNLKNIQIAESIDLASLANEINS